MNYMKRILFITLALVITLAGWCNQTTEGTEFYAAFVNNRNSESPQLRLHIIGINSATVTISNDLMGWSTSVDVLQGGTQEVSVPAAYCYQSESGKSSRSLHITATAPVSVYASNTTDLSGDATLLIPVSGLGTDYMAQTTVSQAMFPAYITAVATQDNNGPRSISATFHIIAAFSAIFVPTTVNLSFAIFVTPHGRMYNYSIYILPQIVQNVNKII